MEETDEANEGPSLNHAPLPEGHQGRPVGQSDGGVSGMRDGVQGGRAVEARRLRDPYGKEIIQQEGSPGIYEYQSGYPKRVIVSASIPNAGKWQAYFDSQYEILCEKNGLQIDSIQEPFL